MNPVSAQPKLFRVSLTAFKEFYVEATSQEEALNHAATENEMVIRGGDADWEFDTGEARALGAEEEAGIRQRRFGEILS